jgi:sugar lactone lactonase YvrE
MRVVYNFNINTFVRNIDQVMKNLSLRIVIFYLIFGTWGAATAQDIYTYAGISGPAGYAGDGGSAILANLSSPRGIIADGAGNIYFCDVNNNVVRKVNASGIISTIAGTGVAGYTGDGGAATLAQFKTPIGINIDGSGNLYIADAGNEVVRKINMASGIISTIAGTGTGGYTGDGGPATAAELASPRGLAITSTGNVYISCYGNNVVRMINSATGNISTVAGNDAIGYSGDGGPATAAMLYNPLGLALDATGNLYIADFNNNVVRKVTPGGIISTFAGDNVAGYSGDGSAATAAELNGPNGLSMDGSGNLYIADERNERVRKVTSGIVSTVAGNGIIGYYGDGGPATSAELNAPIGVSLNTAGNIYVTDSRNNVIRRVGPAVLGISISSTVGDTICAGTSKHFRATVFVDATPHYQWQVNGADVGADSAGYTYTPVTGDLINCILLDTTGGTELAISETLRVDSFPNAGVIIGPPTICVGSEAMLRDSITGGGFGGGIWVSKNASVATIAGPGIITGVATGTDSLFYVSTNACGSDSATDLITVITNTYGPISGPKVLCATDTATYTDATTGGMWAILPGGAPGGSNINNATGLLTAGRRPGIITSAYGMMGCFATDTVTIAPAPRVGPITGPSSVYNGAVITLADTSAGGLWSSASTPIATVDGSGNVTGVSLGMVGITYSVTNMDGCIGYAIDTISVLGTNGVKNVQSATSFSLFPNPATASVILAWSGQLTGNATVVITDVTGKEVLKNEVALKTANSRLSLDISSLKTGIYMVTITSGNGNMCTKLVIE